MKMRTIAVKIISTKKATLLISVPDFLHDPQIQSLCIPLKSIEEKIANVQPTLSLECQGYYGSDTPELVYDLVITENKLEKGREC